MEHKIEISDEMIAEVSGGGYYDDMKELKAWAARHNPEWEGRDPSSINTGELVGYMMKNVPEFDGTRHRGNGPTTYYVKGLPVETMNHEQFMAMITAKYGA